MDTPENVIGFLRVAPQQSLLCLFNLGTEPVEIALGAGRGQLETQAPLSDITPDGLNGGELQGEHSILLPAHGSLFAQLA